MAIQSPLIQSAAGPVAANELGATLLGQHVFTAAPGFRYWPTIDGDRDATLARATAAFQALRRSGIGAVVDTTTIECGRDVHLIAEVSRASGVTIVCSTGLNAEADGVSSTFRTLSPERLADLYVAELAEAVPGTDVRTAAITLASGPQPGEFDETATLAAAFAYAETDAPVLVRAPAEQIEARVDRLIARGVDPERIVACDLDVAAISWAGLDGLGRRGIRLGFTAIGDESRLDGRARAALVAYALRRYGPASVCLGTDATSSRLASADAAELGGGAPADVALAKFAQTILELGVSAELLREALTASVRALFSKGNSG